MTEEQTEYTHKPKCTGEFNGQDEQCALWCKIAVECYERNNP